MIWLDDLLILIQIKERNHADAKTDQEKWFQNKILKKAKNQVKNSLRFLKEEQHIYISNPLGQTFDLKTADIWKVHNLIIYHLNEAPTSSVSAVKMYRCTDGTFILIYPVHLKVIWAVHLKCCNHIIMIIHLHIILSHNIIAS